MSKYAYRFFSEDSKERATQRDSVKMKTPTWINIEENNLAKVSNENSEEKKVMIAAGQNQYHLQYLDRYKIDDLE